MPKLDGTGPMGQGPLTGRGLGPCNNRGNGWNRWGLGLGRGWDRFFRSPKNQRQVLEDEEQALLAELEEIRLAKAELKDQK